MNKKTKLLASVAISTLLLPGLSSADDAMAKRVEMLERELQALKAEMKKTTAVAEKASKSGFKGKGNTTYSFARTIFGG